MELINGSWQQTIAYLIEDYISKSEANKNENLVLISELLRQSKSDLGEIIDNKNGETIQSITGQLEVSRSVIINQIENILSSIPSDQTPIINLIYKLLDEVKKEPIIKTQIITKYINTETIKYIYVAKKEEVKEPVKRVETLSYNPTSEWKPVEGQKGWLIKEDQFGRQYFKYGAKGRIMRPDEFRRWTKSENKTTYYWR